MTEHISSVETIDVRFPTSHHRDGSDAMNPFPDYSAAYITLRTSTGAEGHGLVFTVGRGTEIIVAAVRTLASMVVGRPVEELLHDPGGAHRARDERPDPRRDPDRVPLSRRAAVVRRNQALTAIRVGCRAVLERFCPSCRSSLRQVSIPERCLW
jgi:L-alanine-DL-glutamate epimerase-like enolase superfamily enzyme